MIGEIVGIDQREAATSRKLVFGDLGCRLDIDARHLFPKRPGLEDDQSTPLGARKTELFLAVEDEDLTVEESMIGRFTRSDLITEHLLAPDFETDSPAGFSNENAWKGVTARFGIVLRLPIVSHRRILSSGEIPLGRFYGAPSPAAIHRG